MGRLFIILGLALLLVATASAQSVDYTILNLRVSYAAEVITVSFSVANEGTAAATQTATVLLVDINDGTELARESVAPLGGQTSQDITITLPAEDFPVGMTRTLRLSVGIDEVESSSSNIANNMARVDINRPAPEELPPPTPTPAPDPVADLVNALPFDTENPVQVAIAAAICGAVLLLLMLAYILLRALFYRPPTFGVWQPPYANMPPQNPNTTPGRRQGWQQHAQNDLPAPRQANEGSAHIRKRLVGLDNGNLSNWRIMAVRLSQYDQYGRVARSQVLATGRMVRRLDRIAHRQQAADPEVLRRKLNGIVGGLVKRLRRRITDRSAMLPLALDLRFQGTHGEVRILFELYYLEQGQWRKVDQWEPEMMVVGKTIDEGFTYSLSGQRPDENLKAFTQRLRGDISQILAEMIQRAATDEGWKKTTGSMNAVSGD